MELWEEWNKIVSESHSIYIYGAGKIGRKIFNLIKRDNHLDKLYGFLVSDIRGGWNPTSIEGKPVIEIKKLNEKDSTILVSVSDIYQNEILELLQKLGYYKVICAYKYSFLDEEETLAEQAETVMIDLRELLMQQHENLVFNRYDILVRLLAVEAYYGKNDFGFNLYERMQNNRVYEGYAESAVKRFEQLIASVEKHGYDRMSEIIVDINLRLIDGSHRLALAIYHNISQVKIRVLKRIEEIHYGMEWFFKCFNESGCDILREQYKAISAGWRYPIKGIIWPAANAYFDEITEMISNSYEVDHLEDFELPQEIFDRFVHGVYHVDDIAEWKVESKIEHFGTRSIYRVRMMDIYVPFPDFRIKRTGTTISRQGERLKKLIREEYQSKVENYFHDIIFHTADNYAQSEYIEMLTREAFPMRQLFKSISDLDWMLIKTENDYFPKNFPDAYPAYKDIDVICRREEAEALCERLVSFFQKYENGRYKTKVVPEKKKGFRIRFELVGFLIFQVDVSWNNYLLQEAFLVDSLNRKTDKGGYFVCNEKDEVIYRIAEVYRHPQKKKHLYYVKDNLDKLIC